MIDWRQVPIEGLPLRTADKRRLRIEGLPLLIAHKQRPANSPLNDPHSGLAVYPQSAVAVPQPVVHPKWLERSI